MVVLVCYVVWGYGSTCLVHEGTDMDIPWVTLNVSTHP